MGLAVVPHHQISLRGSVFIGQHTEKLINAGKVIFDLYFCRPDELYARYKFDGQDMVSVWTVGTYSRPQSDGPVAHALYLAYEAAVDHGLISAYEYPVAPEEVAS